MPLYDKSNDNTAKSQDFTSAENTGSTQIQYQLHPLRWWLQIFFTTALLSNGFIMVGFSPVSSNIAAIYNCQQIIVDLQCLLFLIMFIPANFLVIKVLDLYGLRACLLIGSVMTISGCWLRQIVTAVPNFGVVFPGTILCATAQVFFINTGSKLATNWFGDNERALATALGGLALPIGCVVGFVVPIFFMGGDHDTLDDFTDYLITQNVMVTILCLPILFIAREKPPTPPSLSANKTDPKLEFSKELGKLLQNKSYLFLTGVFTFLYGIYTSLGAVVASVTAPFGYTPTDNGIFGATFIFFGVCGSFFFGIMLDKYAKYKLIINFTSTMAVLFIALAFWTLQSGSVALFSVNLAFVGFFVIPIIPSSYAFAVELTYPVPESMSNGMMIMVSQIYGASLGALASFVCGINGTQGPLIAIGIFVTSCALGALCSYFIKEELRRLRPNTSNSITSPYSSNDFSGKIRIEKSEEESQTSILLNQQYKSDD
eukprot:403368114